MAAPVVVISDSEDEEARKSWKPVAITIDDDEEGGDLLSFSAFSASPVAPSTGKKSIEFLGDEDREKENSKQDEYDALFMRPQSRITRPSLTVVSSAKEKPAPPNAGLPSQSSSSDSDSAKTEENLFSSIGIPKPAASSSSATTKEPSKKGSGTKKHKLTAEEREERKQKKDEERMLRRQMKQSEAEEKKRKREEDKAKAKSQSEAEKKRKLELKMRNRKKSIQELIGEFDIFIEPAVSDDGGGSIVAALQKLPCTTKMTALPIPSSIEIYNTKSEDEEGPLKHLVLRITGKEFTERIEMLDDFTQLLQCRGVSARVTVLVEGLQRYKHELSLQSNRLNRAAVQSNTPISPALLSNISQLETKVLESSVTLQLRHGIQVWNAANAEESAAFLTKLVWAMADAAQKAIEPFDNFCALSVKKSSGGMRSFQNLWKNQLMVITGLSEEIAHAIISKFPTAHSLLNIYSETSPLTERQKEELLSNVPIVRADGKTMNRVVGPVLSRKIYSVFTTDNPENTMN